MDRLLSKQSLALPFRDKCELHTKGRILDNRKAVARNDLKANHN